MTSKSSLLVSKIDGMLTCLSDEYKEEKRRNKIRNSQIPGRYRLLSYRQDYHQRVVVSLADIQSPNQPKISKGDNVALTYSKERSIKGISIGSEDGHPIVVLDIKMEEFRGLFSERLPSARTYEIRVYTQNQTSKIIKGLETYQDTTDPQTVRLMEILVGSQQPTARLNDNREMGCYTPQLNLVQRETVLFAINQNELALIHGPPGTGKTITLVDIIWQEVTRGHKVIACAPSNVACDNITEKLVEGMKRINRRLKIVRLGHPARQFYHLIKYSIDSHIKWGVSLTEKEKELKKILPTFDVIVTTLIGASPDGVLSSLKEKRIVIIDESAQANEPISWMPLQFASKLILAGDFKQLQPIVLCQKISIINKLQKSLLERLFKSHRASAKTLTVQYRMSQVIMQWPSQIFYDSKLVASDTVKNIRLNQLPGVTTSLLTSSPIIFIDTSDFENGEVTDPHQGHSKGNRYEVEVVKKLTSLLIRSGVKSSQISIISPYNYQVTLLIKRLGSGNNSYQIGSVDKFQGRENEVIVLSMVRSNQSGALGFLKDRKRFNVALTRAKRLLVVIGDMSTLCSNSLIGMYFAFVKQNGTVFSSERFLSAENPR